MPVRIRNISPSGALIQGDELPPAGTGIRLIRGSLVAAGDVRWVRAGKAGLSFTDGIRVTEWLASCAQKTHQHGVDEIVAAVRTGTVPKAQRSAETAPAETIGAPLDACEDLLRVQEMVTDVAERLAADPAVLEKHAGDIQRLDAAVAIVASLRKTP